MNIIDSSGWFEYFADGPNARFFSRPIQDTVELMYRAVIYNSTHMKNRRSQGREVCITCICARNPGRHRSGETTCFPGNEIL